MNIIVKVHPRSKKPRIEQEEGSMFFNVWVTEPPAQGRANEAVIKALASHFALSASSIKILRGTSTNMKVVSIPINHGEVVRLKAIS